MPLSESLRMQAMRELTETLCAACGKEKKKNQSFCHRCYFSLTPDERQSLYTSYPEYASIYDELKTKLRAEAK